MNQKLLEAIESGVFWMPRFTRREYAKAFKEYSEAFGPAYVEAVRETGEVLNDLVCDLLDALAEGQARQRFWNRAVWRTNEKMMLVQYLSPMLLALEEPGCQEFAELLRDGWAARWPKDAYQIAPHERLKGGFRNSILGIDLSSIYRAPEDDG